MARKQNEADVRAEEYLAVERSLSARTKVAHITLLTVCALLLVGLGLALCLLPHKSFSPKENRTLTTKPTVSWEALLNGTLTRSLSDFCADQFPLRTQLISLKAASELMLGKQQNNDVLLGSDGYLIKRQEYATDNRECLMKNVEAVSRFKQAMTEADIPFTFAVVPRSVDVNTTKLPPLYDTVNASAVWSWLAEACDQNDQPLTTLTAPIRAAAEQGNHVYFKTDHHWTPLGAYYAYVALGDALGYEHYSLSDFSEDTVCTDFLGTTYASSGMHWMQGEPITLLRYTDDTAYLTEVIEGGSVTKTLEGLYDVSAIETHDKYNVFLGGTNTHIRVTSTSGDDRLTLLMLKDSFSQSLAPLLARHYDLILIDPRTYKAVDTTLYDLITQYAPDHVLLLYGIDTLCDAPSLNALTIGLK